MRPFAISCHRVYPFVHRRRRPAAGLFAIIETINAPGKGPPRHRHPEAEVFRVLEGRYLYEMDGRRFYADAGDVVSIPGGAEPMDLRMPRTSRRASTSSWFPALDAAAFFTELAGAMRNGVPDKAALNRFGAKWRVEFLGPPVARRSAESVSATGVFSRTHWRHRPLTDQAMS